jgi:hypothetical protein
MTILTVPATQPTTTPPPARLDASADRECTPALLAEAVSYAIMAPSSHNAQPWTFNLRWNGLEIALDRSRVLPVADPAAREMIISCGAALQNLRIALRHFGFAAKVDILPHASAPDVLARVEVGGQRIRSRLNDLLFAAISERHTNRASFLPEPVPQRLIAAMRSAAELEGAWLYQTTDSRFRPLVADFVARADRLQWVNRKFRHELAAWMRPNDDSVQDGLPGRVFGFSDFIARIAPTIMRRMPLGSAQAKHDRAAAIESPLLIALGTRGDTPRDWMEAGQALQLVLLVAAAHGISASFLNQPLQVPSLRSALRSKLGITGYPQVILRMGFAPPTTATPRRALPEVLDRHIADLATERPVNPVPAA